MKHSIRILLVDDSPYFLTAARDFLNSQESLEVVLATTDEGEALMNCSALRPDVILLDLNLANGSGLQLIPKFHEALPQARVIVLTMMEQSSYRPAALQAGADGFVHKLTMSATLVPTIMEVVKGAKAQPASSTQPQLRSEENQIQLQFLRFAELLPDMIFRYEFKPKRGFTFVSPAAVALTGYTPEEHYADPDIVMKIVQPEDHHLLRGFPQGDVALNKPLMVRCARKDGRKFWIEQRSFPVYDTEGVLVAIEGIARDITESRQAESALRESEETYRIIVENVDEIVYRVYADEDPMRGRVQFVSPQVENILGYKPSEFLSDSDLWASLIHPDDGLRVAAATRILWNSATAITRDYRVRHKSTGEYRWVEDKVSPTFDLHGVINGYQGAARDITERRQQEDVLRDLSHVVEQTADNVFITDRKGVIQFVNTAFEQCTGYAKAEALGATPSLLKSGKHLPEFYEKLWKTIEAGEVFRAEFINRKRSGELFYEEKTITPILDVRGMITHFVSVGRDVSERKRDETALQNKEARLSSILSHAAEAVIVVNEEQRIESFNEAAQRIFGYQEAEMLGRPLDMLLPTRFVNVHRKHIEQFAASPELGRMMRVRDELWCRRKDGSEFISEIGISKHQEGGRRYFTAIVMDISARKQVQAELQESLAETRRSRSLLLAISESAEAVQRARSVDEVYEAVTAGVARLGYRVAIMKLHADGKHITLSKISMAEDILHRLEKLSGINAAEFAIPIVPNGIFHRALDGNEPVLDPGGLAMVAEALPPRLRGLTAQIQKVAGLTSAVAARLTLSGKPHALLVVNGEGLSEQDVPAIRTFAAQASIALENARLYESLRSELSERERTQLTLQESEQRSHELFVTAELQARDLALLDKVRTVIAQELDLQKLLTKVVESIAATFGYSLVSLYLLEAEELVLQHQVGYERVFERIRLTQGVTGRVVRSGQAELVEDVRSDPDFIGAFEGIVSEIGVPLFDGGKVIGFLNVESTRGVKLNRDDLKLMSALGKQIDIAISRARLFGDVQRRGNILSALQESTFAIMGELQLNEALNSILQQAAQLMGTSHGYLYRVDDEQASLHVDLGIGVFDGYVGTSLLRNEGLAGKVWQSAQPLNIEDYQTWSGHSSRFTSIPFHAVVGVPLLIGARVTGVLGLGRVETGDPFTPEDVELLTHFARLAAIALENARLYSQMQQELVERERAQAETVQRNRELATLNRFGQRLSQLAGREQIFEIVEAAIGEVLDNRNLYLALYDESRSRISFPLYTIEGKSLPRAERELGNGLTEYIVRTKAPLLISERMTDITRQLGIDSFGAPSESYLGVPLLQGERAIGVLAIQDYDKPFAYTEHELELLSTVAAAAATALENTRLYESLNLELSERKRAEEELLKAEQSYRALVENTLEGIGRSTLDGKMLSANPALVRLNGYETEAELISAVNDIAGEWYVDTSRREEFLGTLLEHDEVQNFESEIYRHRTRERIWISESARLVRDADGLPLWVEATIQDISERKRAEFELQEARSFLQQVVDTSPSMIFVKDPRGRAVFVNQSTADYYGGTPEQLVSHSTEEVHQARQEAEDFVTDDQEVIRTRQRIVKDELNTAPDGSQHWFHTVKVPLLRPDGSVDVLGISTDITDRKAAEKKIRDQVDRLTTLSEIDRAISSSFDVRMSLNLLLSRAQTLLAVDAVAVLLMNPLEYTLEYGAGLGFRTETLRTASVRLNESYAGTAATEQRIVQLPDLNAEGEHRFQTGFLKEENFAGYYGTPLIVKGKVVGVLEAFHRSVVTRDQDWLDFFGTLAGQAAIAIDNANLFLDLQRSNQDLSLAYEATIEGWSRALDLRDRETEGHTLRVTEKTVELARRIGLPDDQLIEIRRGALLHDIGKMGVPDSILLKTGALTEDEWDIMHKHPTFAYELLTPIRYLKASAIDIPYAHHEKWDGSGYPRGLKGEQIPLSARIFAVVDVWDALTSDRPYRPAWSADKARAHIASLAGTHFDPKIAKICLESGILDNPPTK